MSLTGKSNISIQNLLGTSKTPIQSIFLLKINEIKLQVMNNLMIPLIHKNWNELITNNLVSGLLYESILKYENYDKDLILYKHLIESIKSIINEHEELKILEKKIYSNQLNDNNEITHLFYKLPFIKLKAEYEIYNLIIGKPSKPLTYNENIISFIQILLKEENMTFDKIKNQINNQFI